MEILKREGCTAWCLDADGKPIVDMSDEEKDEILENIIEGLCIDKEELIGYLVRAYGDYECSDRPCEECGDYIEEWRLGI